MKVISFFYKNFVSVIKNVVGFLMEKYVILNYGSGKRDCIYVGGIVSLTSFGNRLKKVHLTILTLMNQSLLPEKIVLWVSYEDIDKIPSHLLAMQDDIFIIRYCEDIKSYKKLIPSLIHYPEKYIATADDDVFYPNRWFELLISESKKSNNCVIAHMAHIIKRSADGGVLPYKMWNRNIRFTAKGCDVFPVGKGGVLYPPYILNLEILKKSVFMKLAPNADDVWFYAITRISDVCCVKINAYSYFWEWSGSQVSALAQSNYENNGNDPQIAAVFGKYLIGGAD